VIADWHGYSMARFSRAGAVFHPFSLQKWGCLFTFPLPLLVI